MIQIATRASEASLLNKKNYCFIIFIIKKIERKTSLSIMCKKMAEAGLLPRESPPPQLSYGLRDAYNCRL